MLLLCLFFSQISDLKKKEESNVAERGMKIFCNVVGLPRKKRRIKCSGVWIQNIL